MAAAVSVAAALLYSPSLRFGWVWDDRAFVATSPALGDLAGLRAALSTDLYRTASPEQAPSPYWRPSAMVSYWAAARAGAGPGPQHLMNILLHAAATFLIALLLVRRVRNAPMTIVAVVALWWSLHPMHVEPVAWISGRYDLAAGVVAAALFALDSPSTWPAALVTGILFLAGLCAKESFVLVAPALVASAWIDIRLRRAALLSAGSIGVATLAWIALRQALDIRAPDPVSPAAAVGSWMGAISTYLVRAVAPLPLTTGHTWNGGSFWGVLLGATVAVGLGTLAFRVRRLVPPATLFLGTMIPVAVAMVTLRQAPDRYFYLPSIGLAWLLGEGLAAVHRSHPRVSRIAIVAAMAVILLDAGSSWLRLPDWRSDYALFTSAVRVNHDDWEANAQLGLIAAANEMPDEALRLLERAQAARPQSSFVANTLAWLHLDQGRPEQALAQAQRAIELSPRFAEPRYFLARAAHRLGRHEMEVRALDDAVRLAPRWADARAAQAAAGCELRPGPRCTASSWPARY